MAIGMPKTFMPECRNVLQAPIRGSSGPGRRRTNCRGIELKHSQENPGVVHSIAQVWRHHLVSGRAVVERYAEGLAANDAAVLRECLHPDYLGRYPQSGEVIRGPANLLAIAQSFPGQEQGRLSTSVAHIRGRDDEFV